MNRASRQPKIVYVLGDQLTPSLAALRGADPKRDVVLMAEVADEATYVRHHKKKIAFVFSAMRHFASELRGLGWSVDYVFFDDPGNSGSLTGELDRALARTGLESAVITLPGEWRLLEAFEAWTDTASVSLEILEDDRFLCSRTDFVAWFNGRKTPRMEFFYRYMRRRTGLLMDGDQPVGGRWNFDDENRKPPAQGIDYPAPFCCTPDIVTQQVLDLVDHSFRDHFGSLEPFVFAVTRSDAEAALEHFVATGLPRFGDYQDAMVSGESVLFHSAIALYLNCGLLDPLAVCQRIEAAWRDGAAPLNAAEGFIRQIVGWREYVRGFYWRHMPDLANANYFNHRRPLPDFFWTGDTDMACVGAAIAQTRDEAYAHHIQRLMITGNFANLAGIDPHAVHQWYLAVYADAYEWVELPNTIGMSQFADGGILASKPYVAGGNYINRMSDYCAGCRFKATVKSGPDACPFNYLYWDFLVRHREKLESNARLGVAYRNWDRFDGYRQRQVRRDAAAFLASLDAPQRMAAD